MHYSRVDVAYFSPSGGTQKVAQALLAECTGQKTEHNFLLESAGQEIVCAPADLLIAVFPVYAGRIPELCLQRLERFKGTGGPALAVVVYGNRDYDDALLELKNLLEKNGFFVLGAAAFIARHSIFRQVASGRPDDSDLASIADFIHQCQSKLASLDSPAHAPQVSVRGNFPYLERKAVALQPSIDAASCTVCGACVEVCPTKALLLDQALTKDAALCISCAACIDVCPTQAQAFRGPQFEAYAQVFTEKCSPRKEPEIFL